MLHLLGCPWGHAEQEGGRGREGGREGEREREGGRGRERERERESIVSSLNFQEVYKVLYATCRCDLTIICHDIHHSHHSQLTFEPKLWPTSWAKVSMDKLGGIWRPKFRLVTIPVLSVFCIPFWVIGLSQIPPLGGGTSIRVHVVLASVHAYYYWYTWIMNWLCESMKPQQL